MSKTEEQKERDKRLHVLFMTESALGQRYVEFKEEPSFDLRKQIRSLEKRRETLIRNIQAGEY